MNWGQGVGSGDAVQSRPRTHFGKMEAVKSSGLQQ